MAKFSVNEPLQLWWFFESQDCGSVLWFCFIRFSLWFSFLLLTASRY